MPITDEKVDVEFRMDEKTYAEYCKIRGILKEILKKDDSTIEDNPYRKSYNILAYMRRQKIHDKILSKLKDEIYQVRGEKYIVPSCKKKIKEYSREDIEEIIIYKLNRLETEGINHKRKLEKENDTEFKGEEKNWSYKFKRDLDYNHPPIISQWAYEGSLGEIKDTREILSNKKLLIKKGISKEDIEKYEETFKKRVNRILLQGMKYAITPAENELLEDLLIYCKKNDLIAIDLEEKSNLEKKL